MLGGFGRRERQIRLRGGVGRFAYEEVARRRLGLRAFRGCVVRRGRLRGRSIIFGRVAVGDRARRVERGRREPPRRRGREVGPGTLDPTDVPAPRRAGRRDERVARARVEHLAGRELLHEGILRRRQRLRARPAPRLPRPLLGEFKHGPHPRSDRPSFGRGSLRRNPARMTPSNGCVFSWRGAHPRRATRSRSRVRQYRGMAGSTSE